MRGKEALPPLLTADVAVRPLTPERWTELESLFAPNGACGGCWCMWWRQSNPDFLQRKGEKNRRALRRIVLAGEVPGVIASVKGRPAGWCSVAPRETFPRLSRSRVLAKVDDEAVWSVVCFYVARPFRRGGLSEALLRGALELARAGGARIVEGYPVDTRKGSMADVFAYTGLVQVFRRVGFEEVARRSRTRPVMRYTWRSKAKTSVASP